MKANKKKPYGHKLFLAAMVLGALLASKPAHAREGDIEFTTPGGHTFKLPFQSVDATQLYSFREGRGFPGLQTVLYASPRKKFQASFGAAAELGESRAVPFAGAQWKLTERLFRVDDNRLMFGVAAAKHFRPESKYKSWRGVEATINVSHPLF
jgi:hypothetical protein